MENSENQQDAISNAVRVEIQKVFEEQDAQKIITALINAPDYTRGERVHFAILKYALQSEDRMKGFEQGFRVAKEDWRDLLVQVGLANENWPEVLYATGMVDQDWLDSHTRQETMSRPAASLFRMKVDGVYTIRGRGVSVTGQIESGELDVRDEVRVLNKELPRKLIVAGIEAGRKSVDRASQGMKIEIHLPNIEKDDIKRGDILTG